MKKRLFCVLCVFLCLILCSCQIEHLSLLSLVENGEYSEAIDYINRLARADMDAEHSEKDAHPLIPYLYGTWESAVDEDVPIFQFNEDGTCLVDGQAHLWRETIVKDTVDNRVQVDVLRGDKLVYVFQLVHWSDGIYSGSANKMKNDTNYITHYSNLRNRATCECIEITKENWETYFEIVQDTYVEKFLSSTRFEAEQHNIGIYQGVCFILKEEYYKRLDTTFTKINAKYTFKIGCQPIKYDWNTDTYTLNGDFESTHSEATDTTSLQRVRGSRFGCWIDSSWNTFPDDSAKDSFVLPHYIDLIQIADIEGTLALSKESQ